MVRSTFSGDRLQGEHPKDPRTAVWGAEEGNKSGSGGKRQPPTGERTDLQVSQPRPPTRGFGVSAIEEAVQEAPVRLAEFFDHGFARVLIVGGVGPMR